MAFLFLLDYLTGQLALVNTPGAATPPTPSNIIPIFFTFIPQ